MITIINRLSPDNVVHPRGLRRDNSPFIAMWILYYAWAVVFVTWWTASPVTDSVFDTQFRNLMHTVTLLSSAVFVFIIRKEWLVYVSRIGIALVFLSMILFYTLPSTELRIFAAVMGSIAIGCVNICVLIPFIFILNNTEKLYAVVFSNIMIQLISLINEHSLSGLVEPVMSFVLLIFSMSIVLFYWRKARHVQDPQEITEKPIMSPRVYLALLFNFVIVILCKGVGKGILTIATDYVGNFVLTWYYIGSLIGCLVYVLVYAYTKKAYIWLGNITFSSVAIGLLCNAFISRVPLLAAPFTVLLGIGSTIGMINMYYIAGVIGKKYNSMRFIRLFIFFIGLCGGISGIVVGNMISGDGTLEVSIYASILSVVVMIAFMFVSPIMDRANYVNDWGADSNHTEVGGGQLMLFKPYGLSKREAEVCVLLLQGYTLRQISAILPIAYSTVNTYCTSAYRKLGINSRTELLLKFKDLITK